MTARQTPPPRRMHTVRRISLAGTTLHLGIGCDMATGEPREVFITGGKEGSDVQLLVQHVATLISMALQHGAAPETLARAMTKAEPASGWPSLLVPSVLAEIIAEKDVA